MAARAGSAAQPLLRAFGANLDTLRTLKMTEKVVLLSVQNFLVADIR
jgi:hypothetical protein